MRGARSRSLVQLGGSPDGQEGQGSAEAQEAEGRQGQRRRQVQVGALRVRPAGPGPGASPAFLPHIAVGGGRRSADGRRASRHHSPLRFDPGPCTPREEFSRGDRVMRSQTLAGPPDTRHRIGGRRPPAAAYATPGGQASRYALTDPSADPPSHSARIRYRPGCWRATDATTGEWPRRRYRSSRTPGDRLMSRSGRRSPTRQPSCWASHDPTTSARCSGPGARFESPSTRSGRSGPVTAVPPFATQWRSPGFTGVPV